MDFEAIRAELRSIPDLSPIADEPWGGTVIAEVLEGDATVVRLKLGRARVELRFGEDGEVEGWKARQRACASLQAFCARHSATHGLPSSASS